MRYVNLRFTYLLCYLLNYLKRKKADGSELEKQRIDFQRQKAEDELDKS